MATVKLNHRDSELSIEEMPTGKKLLTIYCFDSATYVPLERCETSYPMELIKLTLEM